MKKPWRHFGVGTENEEKDSQKEISSLPLYTWCSRTHSAQLTLTNGCADIHNANIQRLRVYGLYRCFCCQCKLNGIQRRRAGKGQEASPIKPPPFIVELQLCADLVSNKPTLFDCMLTWRHVIGMNPNIRLLQLTL